MRIEPLQRGDWPRFIELAGAESWLVPESERALFQNGWRRYLFSLRKSERICGFVSAVPHQQGGWIGNLIVARDCRNRGYGAALFEHAVQLLERAGCRDLWLTASVLGRPLYEKKGFRAVDRTVRWVLAESGALQPPDAVAADGLEMLCRQDRKVWGDCRRDLLLHLGRQATVLRQGRSIALLQAGRQRRVLGPWLSEHGDPADHRRMLERLAGGGEIVADIVASAGLETVLEAAGFRRLGENALMVRSRQRPGQLEGLVALASLGSIG
jgi:GNAT superfamily N-acetyltransferase